MMLFWFFVGVTLPTLSGWCMLRFLEGRYPVLLCCERWILGCALSLPCTMFLTFIASGMLGLPLTLMGFLGVQIATLFITGGLWFSARPTENILREHRMPATRIGKVPSTTMKIFLTVLCLWTAGKIGAVTFDAVTTPSFFNDSITNWNARAKVYVTRKEFSLSLPSDRAGESPGGIRSYPPAVPLMKAWLVALAGRWDEGLVNALHPIWFLILLASVFLTLRHHASFVIAALGMYLLSSIPLVMLHGLAAYADMFMALHLFIPAMLLFHALCEEQRGRACAFLRLFAFAVALVPFTKNEGLLLYFPTLIFIALGTHWFLRKRGILSTRDILESMLWILFFIMIFVLPWLAFKWTHGLEFGNAKPLDAFTVAWQPGVLQSIGVSLFFHGSWLLLFPLLLFLLITQWRAAFTSNILLLTSLFLLLFFGQMSLYLWTGLSFEALKLTGYERGLLHVMPIAAVLIALLAAKAMPLTLSGTSE